MHRKSKKHDDYFVFELFLIYFIKLENKYFKIIIQILNELTHKDIKLHFLL
jgi:hypothetical protein